MCSSDLKRSRHGMLFQGSIWRPAAAGDVPWDDLTDLMAASLASTLGAEAQHAPWPDFAEGELEGLTEKYSSPEWNDFR